MLASAWTRGDVLGLIGVAIGAVGCVLGVIGFVLAWKQLKRTADAAEATQTALARSHQTQLLMLLPQFRLVEMELDFAISCSGRDLAARALANYAHLAHEVSGVVASYGLADNSTVAAMRESAATATQAKGEIYSKRLKSLSSICQPFISELAGVVSQVSELRAALMAGAPSSNGVMT